MCFLACVPSGVYLLLVDDDVSCIVFEIGSFGEVLDGGVLDAVGLTDAISCSLVFSQLACCTPEQPAQQKRLLPRSDMAEFILVFFSLN